MRSTREMKAIVRLLTGVLLLVGVTGCATSAYFTDRKRDAADVFTLTVGTGGGVEARVGPVQAALFFNRDSAGLRGGEWYRAMNTNAVNFRSSDVMEAATPLPVVLTAAMGAYPFLTSVDKFVPTPGADRRNKQYEAYGPLVPGLTLGNKAHYYTQIEAAVGLGPSLRLGFNPGELLDLVLGWASVDIYGDDVSGKPTGTLTLNIPKREFQMGESIPVTVTLSNDSRFGVDFPLVLAGNPTVRWPVICLGTTNGVWTQLYRSRDAAKCGMPSSVVAGKAVLRPGDSVILLQGHLILQPTTTHFQATIGCSTWRELPGVLTPSASYDVAVRFDSPWITPSVSSTRTVVVLGGKHPESQ